MRVVWRVQAVLTLMFCLVTAPAGETELPVGEEESSRLVERTSTQPSVPASESSQWIAVVAPGLREAIEPLAAFRAKQGHPVVIIDVPAEESNPDAAAALLRRVRETCEAFRGTSCVLLVGAPLLNDDVSADCIVPALKGNVGRMQSRYTDNPNGCIEDDGAARVAVGRFPARTPAEARGMVRKTIAWEREPPPGLWKRRMVLLAGAPSYNEIIDRMVEKLALGYFDRLPPDYRANVIYFNPNSSFTLPSGHLLAQAKAYLDEGQLLTVYIGHSLASGFWQEDGWGDLFTSGDWSAVKLPAARGLFVSGGCFGVCFDTPGYGSYGVAAMRNPEGPVAVIGSEWLDYAAMAMLLSEGLLEGLANGDEPVKLGQLWLSMRQHVLEAPIDPLTYRMLDAIEGDPDTPPEAQRHEHLEMFHLLGDPALSLPRLGYRLDVICPHSIDAGQTIEVTCNIPRELRGAQGRVSVERRLTSVPTDVVPVSEDLDEAARENTMLENHRRANRFELCGADVRGQDAGVCARLKLPDQLGWSELVVRVWLSNGKTEGQGVCVIRVRTENMTGQGAGNRHDATPP